MSRDHYAVLGVSPTSEDVVIRAAYRALMRRYHPDADPSGEAAQRAQSINAAYAVLGDPEKRARYDGSLAAQGLIKPEPPQTSLAHRIVPGPAGMVGLVALAATATLIVISPPIGVVSKDALPSSPNPRPSSEAEISVGRERGELRPIAEVDAVKPPEPVSAAAEVPNAMLEPAEEIMVPEGTRVPAARKIESEPSPQEPERPTVAPRQAAAKPASAASRTIEKVGATASAQTALSECRLGSGWADRAICGSTNLTALDRQQGLLYAQSLAKADQAKRAALVGSRDRFQTKRDACRSENCLTTTYIARLREISDIMARGSQQ